MNLRKIKRALISVSDKSNLEKILPTLKKFKIEIISSGGSFKKIKSLKYKCIEISNYTGYSEILNGRVKTLHPKIHAGILNVRSNKDHKKDLKEKKIPNIDLVIVDLYPFEKEMEKEVQFANLIEYIDIGGPTLIRSSAKNYMDVTVLSSIADYSKLVEELNYYQGSTTVHFRKLMSAKAFSLTAYYDSVISNYFNRKLNIKFPERKTIHGNLVENLRYGENPHQNSSLYSTSLNSNIKQVHGKSLSYNNYNDIYSTLSVLKSFKKNIGVAIIKHANPCGVSLEENQITSFNNALNCDPISAFGGIVGINSKVSKKLANALSKKFFEVIVAKDFDKNSLKILKKKNIRLINFKNLKSVEAKHHLFLDNCFLSQDSDNTLIKKKLKIVTQKKPSAIQIRSLVFAFNVCKFVKSNAIVLSSNKSTIGIGAGQPSRVDSCKIAVNKALKFAPKKINNSVAASDAFFPFPDGIKELTKFGVKAIIQPGGSVNDRKVIKEANKAGIAMVFTGTRHFKH